MKKIFLIIILLLPMIVFAQSRHIDLGGFTSMSGRNIVANYGWEFEKSEIDVGVKYLFRNPPERYWENMSFIRQFYPDDFVEHFGANFGYKRYFNLFKTTNKISWFINTQLTYSELRNRFLLPYTICYCPDRVVLHQDVFEQFKEILLIETNLGVSVKTDISDKLHLITGAGVGLGNMYIDDKRRVPWPPYHQWEREISVLFFVQLEYQLAKKDK